jgi:hypothetical protein
MLLVSLFALALAAADAPSAASAPTASAEVAAAAANAPSNTPPEEPFPIGAPTDDYGFVSWCYGALSGHMELYKVVKPELDKLPDPNPKETKALDAAQMKAGREYLTLYKRAIEAAEKASPKPISVHGAQALKTGANIWTPAMEAEPKTRMWSYLSWDLPGRCETTAERLYEKSLLQAQMLGITIEDPADIKPAAKPAAKPPAKPQAKAVKTTATAAPTATPSAAAADLRGLQ